MLPATIRPHALGRLRWHQGHGDAVLVVSGQLDVALAHWCAQHGVELPASRLEIRAGTATGRYESRCAGAEKARRIRERFDLAAFDTIHAYGDTPEDEAMLALAHRRWYRWEERAPAERRDDSRPALGEAA